MATVKTILKKTRTEVVVKLVGLGSATITMAEMAMGDETLATPQVAIHQARWSGAAADTTVVVRNAVDVLRLTGSGDWEFNGYAVAEQPGSDLVVSLSANTTLILSLRKIGGYVGPTRSAYLTGGA